MLKDLIALKLKQLRNEKGYSAEYVISELKNFGTKLSTVTLYGYENGVSQPKCDTFLQLCKIYDVTSFDIFFDENEPYNPQTPYDRLNEIGKAKADEYIGVLAENKKYTEHQPTISDDIVKKLTQDSQIPIKSK